MTETNERLEFPTSVIYPLMVDAHLKAAETAAYHIEQLEAWHEAGKPTKEGYRGMQVPDGFSVMGGMNYRGLQSYLENQLRRIRFVGLSVSDTITLSYEEFLEYTRPEYFLKGDRHE